uniref:Uncharacterized protein n=1 Tax=Pseudenhygromyxa salsuginis TaxID=442868 RepID=A0A3S7UVC4_9BACT|nr:hypothetical protein [Pseudenhygromyxa salsuginis]
MRRGILAAGAAASLACLTLDPPPPRSAAEFTASRELVELDRLPALRAAADAEPESLRAQWQAGMAHLRACLQGHVDQRDLAEHYLERAWRLDPHSQQVPVARTLGRFLNMRSAVLDLDRIDLQIAVYDSLLADPELDAATRLQFSGFKAAAEALRRYGRGQTLGALHDVDAMEDLLGRWLDEHPEDIDAHTMLGNFALTFAGVIPVGQRRRLQAGVRHFSTQQDHWQQLSPRARSVAMAPNVRSVFVMQLAEALLAAGEIDEAERRYRQLIELPEQPDTAPRRQILAVAEHRLANLDAYAGADELLPPWPAGVTGCVACHAREATLPTDDLWLLPELALP